VNEKESPSEDPKKAAILAAMERVKAKKDQQKIKPKNTDNLTTAQQEKIAEVDARREQVHSEVDGDTTKKGKDAE
jgi:hypothetical protein